MRWTIDADGWGGYMLEDTASLRSLRATRGGLEELRDFLLREFPLEDQVDRVVERLQRAARDLPDAAIKARRERIATAVLAGLAADPGTNDQPVRVTAEVAVEWADALIVALDKE